MIPNSVSPNKRCVSIDWLELYVLEDDMKYPMDAQYFRDKGYWVKEREYGTRTYKEMFTIMDADGQPWIEVRRNPSSGQSDFSGLVPESCHLRLTNRQCYYSDCVQRLRDFLLKHGYIFKRIYRIDICYDFEYFDSGDLPSAFAHRFIERKYRKVNQSKIHVVGDDSWTDFNWETLSWGNPSSMVSTKLYNKSKEIERVSREKTWIVWKWFESGLIDDPMSKTRFDAKRGKYTPEIWRVEFSIKSSADRWVVIEDTSGKKIHKKAVPHRLYLFDTPEKLWQRFEELAYHYFRFKYREYKKTFLGITRFALDDVQANVEKELQRKDRCKDKVLFYFNRNREFCQLSQLPKEVKVRREDDVLLRHLIDYRDSHIDIQVKRSCEFIIEDIRKRMLSRKAPVSHQLSIEAIQLSIATRLHLPYKTTLEMAAQIYSDIQQKLIF